jgi:hypothetical protein
MSTALTFTRTGVGLLQKFSEDHKTLGKALNFHLIALAYLLCMAMAPFYARELR